MSRYLAATPKELGELVRGFRKQLGWTQARLAEKAGLFPKTISAIEAGSGQVLLANVMRCLSALDLDLSLGSRTAIGTTPGLTPELTPEPVPTAVMPQPTRARVRATAAEPRRPPAGETAASPTAATKRLRSSLASRTHSAAKALREKW